MATGDRSYDKNSELTVLYKILGKFPKTELSSFDYPFDTLNDVLEEINSKLDGGIVVINTASVKVTNFPAIQDVNVTNTPDVIVTNFPATQDVVVTNTASTKVVNFPATQDVNVTNTPTVEVTNFPSTQNVVVTNTASTKVVNFPATQDVNVTNTPTVDVSNFPSTQDVAVTTIDQTTLTPSVISFTTSTATLLEITDTSQLVNVFLLVNAGSSTVYIGFTSSSAKIPLSPNGSLEYDNSTLQMNINSIYVSGTDVDLVLTYWT